MQLLKRKIDTFLSVWKKNPDRKPLIIKGARQIGKTESIRAFGVANYESVIGKDRSTKIAESKTDSYLCGLYETHFISDF